MQDWSSPPAQANYPGLRLHRRAEWSRLVLQGWLYNLAKDTPANAQLIGKRYLGTVDEAGARKVAHEFAADIIALFGGQSLFGTHIYFTSDRTGHKEIWVMDPDGKNQTPDYPLQQHLHLSMRYLPTEQKSRSLAG